MEQIAQYARHDIPFRRFFLLWSETSRHLTTPGGRLTLSLLLTAVFYTALFAGVKKAEWPASACLINLLLSVARNPKSTGVVEKLISLIRGGPHPLL